MRSHYCGLVDPQLTGRLVTVCGWVDTRRDHGGVIFIDLRDHEGVVQCVVEPDQAEAFKVAEGVRSEYCLRIEGRVRLRPDGLANDRLRTGAIEIIAQAVEVLARADPLPFALDESPAEDTRLRYRYLDLRRPAMQTNLRTRTKLVQALRRYLDGRGFLDLETPILTRATPEGARDFLVPSRVHAGEFYALPQSPQLFKQLFMVAGMDRYYQIARCFRDEDLRSDRQLEFTQLDVEMSFVAERELQDLVEALIRDCLREVAGIALDDPFPRLSWAEAMRRYGSDKPDLRCPLELVDVAEALRHVEFKVFAAPANDPGCRVIAVKAPGGASLARGQIDAYQPFVARYGAKGLAWIRIDDMSKGREGLTSPIVKFLDDVALEGLFAATGAATGDLLFFGAGPALKTAEFMGQLRLKLGLDLGLTETQSWRPLWVVDFPMFEWDPASQRYYALHHPFTAPKVADLEALRADPGGAVSRGYDMVLNGNEIGGGSIRIHRPEMQAAVFELLGIDADEAREKFGFLLEALRYGAPPHGGIAFGIDRIAALIVGADSIREVIAYPKTASAVCPLTRAPSSVSAAQLDELHVAVKLPPVDQR